MIFPSRGHNAVCPLPVHPKLSLKLIPPLFSAGPSLPLPVQRPVCLPFSAVLVSRRQVVCLLAPAVEPVRYPSCFFLGASPHSLPQCLAFLVSVLEFQDSNSPALWGVWLRACIDFLSASIDLDQCIEHIYRKIPIAEPVIEAICAKTKELLMKESNVVHIKAPVTVVGDIHGQFFDLLEIFRIGGKCPDTNYLFLGWSFSNALGQGTLASLVVYVTRIY